MYDAINEGITLKQRPGVIKHLRAVGIKKWDDLDKWHLTRFATEVKSSMAASSAHTVFAVVKAFIGRFEDEITLPKDWRKLLEQRNELPMNTYLTAEEVEAFGNAYIDSDAERTVRDGFYVSCKTGLRHSDLVKLLPSNFQGRGDGTYLLSYVSKKTRIQSTIPCSWATVEKIGWLHRHGVELSLDYYNDMVKKLAERAGIDTEVSVFKAGKELSGPKWKFLSSHSARRSFCTIMADKHVPILDIARLAGHSNTQTTMRYVVSRSVDLPNEALDYLL